MTSLGVQAGIELLDDIEPNWPTKIDIKKLDMSSCSFCILGQLYGDYTDGLDIISNNEHDPYKRETIGIKYGFDGVVTDASTHVTTKQAYKPLTNEWKKVITDRLKKE